MYVFSNQPKITMQSSQEGSSERSRSQRGLEVGAAQSIANPVTPSQSMLFQKIGLLFMPSGKLGEP